MKNRFLYITLLAGLMLAGCSQGQNLPFKTIASNSNLWAGQNYEGKEPDFLIIIRPEEVDTPKLKVHFPSELADQLRALDYQRDFVLVVFYGSTTATSPDDPVDIRQITRDRDKVVLKTHFGGSWILPAYSSPYHIVTVTKEGKWAQNIRFALEVDGKEVKEHAYFIP